MGQMLGVYGAVLLLVTTAHMQQIERAPEPGPVIRSTTRLVEVEVLVSDKHGPVRGLTQDDFVVTDRGERQAAKLLSADSSAPPASRGVNLPRNTFSNQQTAAEGTPPTVTILLLD